MADSILHDLYNGKIYPFENIYCSTPEYHKVNGMLADEKERFLKNLSESDRELFKKIEDLHCESFGMYSYENFVHGFRLGVKLMSEAFSGADSLARDDDK